MPILTGSCICRNIEYELRLASNDEARTSLCHCRNCKDAVKDRFRYICVGSLDDPEALPPKGEFFCNARASWMPEIPDIFHKQGIKE
ncbi:Glutathione-dependent formaldehyde-activating enzyme/centromere protein V [Penicillium paradoxum]|uniref:Glutathione-dependent formaldehyde-activating enzyme/centromere protein V n=1 Tax=Penicillium paradoxum TaxID=176176 RepID=UPI002548F0C9|nr:Glutathione-dependent formaldehyde-activating enzyme/centromere protein V [Penicillium paradoxum]KAJ5773785.1 Glutathione-dependent formaldehyde-activating enzyme/centromere protein V [Penicillium paradoxum]